MLNEVFVVQLVEFLMPLSALGFMAGYRMRGLFGTIALLTVTRSIHLIRVQTTTPACFVLPRVVAAIYCV
jgi:hypothetical protein